MAEADAPTLAEALPEPRRSRLSSVGKAIGALLVILLLATAGALLLLDTDPGHRFIADRIEALAPQSGLRIRIGRIDGSIYGDTRLKNLRLSDPQGLFLEAPEARLDWQPLSWVYNRLSIDSLSADLMLLHRLPRLRPSAEPRPILPGFDIRIGRLALADLRIGAAVAGRPRSAQVTGRADIRGGRALVELDAAVRGGGDRLRIALDAEPDRDRFDLDVRLRSPAGGVAGALVGLDRPIDLVVAGEGRWRRWAGIGRLALSGRPVADLALRAESGRYSLSGAATPAIFWTGKKARLTAPRVLLNGSATLADRRLSGRLSLRSAALRLESRGTVDLGAGAYDDLQVAADLLRPAALFPDMSGQRVRGTLLLDGRFDRARFAYRLSAPRFAFDNTGFEEARAEGRGRLSRAPVSVPLLFTARRVTGVGNVVGGILANLRVAGTLKVTARQMTGDGLDLSSDKLRSKLSLFVNLVNGDYQVVLSGGLTRYLIPGLGIVDVSSELKVVPGAGRRGTMVTGTGRAWVRRFDNRFLTELAGGLPRIETGLVRAPDKVIHFRGLTLTAPDLRITGNGYRRTDGSFHFEGSGVQRRYGPFTLLLDGRIDRPRLVIRLARPNEATGLRDVLLTLDPTAQGYAYRAAGGSTLGPFTSAGTILLPRGAPATIAVASLDVSGTRAQGSLRADPGGLTGRLDVAGGGLAGRLLFAPAGAVQRIEAHLTAENARFAGPPPLAIRSGRLDGVVLLDPAGTSVEASFSARGLSRGAVTLARLDGSASLRGGSGRVRAEAAGTRGRAFQFRADAEVAPGRVRLTGAGAVDRRPIALREPALLTRESGGWRLAPTALAFAGGSGTLAGLFGGDRTELDARLDGMPLTVLDIPYPRLGLGGVASGTLNYRSGENPSGAADLRIRGLTRAGLVLSSRPVDIGLAARLTGAGAAVRAVASSQGQTIGRAQARLAPLGPGGELGDRLMRSPLFAQIRYNGAADTLWRLTGLELLDFSGPLAIGADITGTLDRPLIRGSLRTDRGRLESAVTGTVVENIQASGRFGGSRLLVDRFTGSTVRGGTVSGRGVFDFAAAAGIGMDLRIDANAAQLIDRDDLKAQVTGPVTITSDGSGGRIAGSVRLVSGAFRLGSATAAQGVPRLAVRELNRPDDDAPPPIVRAPWTLDLDVASGNVIRVTGLGLNSLWSTDLKVAGSVTQPRITGDAELYRGSYDFAGRRFDLERGTIRFQGEAPVNPVLDIVAEGGIQGLNAVIRVTGRGQKPEIAFTSTPALPQDELLSRLLFGTSITNLSAPEALQLAAAVASLQSTGPSLDPINAVRSATGLDRLRILPADVTTGQGTAIAAGKYLGRRVYVEVITDGRGYSATQIEYQITRWLSLLSSISTIGRESINVRVSRDY